MLNINLSTIIFQVINFLVLFALLYFFLFKNIVKQANERRKKLDDIHQETMENYKKSETLRSELEKSLENIHKQVDGYISKAKAELEVDRHQVLEETKSKAEQIIKQAQSNASTIQMRAVEETQDKIMDVIVDIVGNMIKNSTPDEFHDSLIKQINDRVWEMGKKEMRNVEMIRKSLEEREPTLTVMTPRQLTKEQQSSIIRTFSALADKNVKLHVSKDESLVSGLHVRLGDFIIDNSIKAKLEDIKENAMEEVKANLLEINE